MSPGPGSRNTENGLLAGTPTHVYMIHTYLYAQVATDEHKQKTALT